MAIEPLPPPLITPPRPMVFSQSDSEKLNDLFNLVREAYKNSENPEIQDLYLKSLDIMVK